MKARVLTYLVICIWLPACSDSQRGIPLIAEPWVITGVVISEETQKVLPGRTIVLQRNQPGTGSWICGGCLAGHPGVFFTKSDASGRFYFSSRIPGYFTVAAECPGGRPGLPSPSYEPLHEITSGTHNVTLNYRETLCTAVSPK